jgi:2'-5' RNA ligase
MALAVCMLFDPSGESAVRRLWERLEEKGVRSLLTHTHGRHHPHLSYVVLRTYHVEAIQHALSGLPDAGPFELSFHGIVVFPRGRVCVVPSVTSDVVRRQEDVVTATKATGADVHRHYAYGEWVPHISLAPRAIGSQLAIVTKAVTDVLPLTLTVDRAALIDSSTGQLWPLPLIP